MPRREAVERGDRAQLVLDLETLTSKRHRLVVSMDRVEGSRPDDPGWMLAHDALLEDDVWPSFAAAIERHEKTLMLLYALERRVQEDEPLGGDALLKYEPLLQHPYLPRDLEDFLLRSREQLALQKERQAAEEQEQARLQHELQRERRGKRWAQAVAAAALLIAVAVQSGRSKEHEVDPPDELQVLDRSPGEASLTCESPPSCFKLWLYCDGEYECREDGVAGCNRGTCLQDFGTSRGHEPSGP